MNSTPPQIPVQPLWFTHRLSNFARRLDGSGSITTVALGSSTTAGEGDIAAYPGRLERLLRESFDGRMIDVLNRGVGGEEAPKERDRIVRDVLPESPCLVIWQVGTNCVWQSAADHPPSHQETIAALRDGIAMLQESGATDVVLMDLQYLPAVLTPATIDATRRMVDAIATVAKDTSVNLFRRFELMKRWVEIGRYSFDALVNPTDDKRLHQSELATRMLAEALRTAIVEAAKRPAVS